MPHNELERTVSAFRNRGTIMAIEPSTATNQPDPETNP
jgi:hypothetical protein